MEAAKSLYNFKDTDKVKSCINKLKSLTERYKKEKKDCKQELLLEKIYHVTKDKKVKKEIDKISSGPPTHWFKFKGNLQNTGQSRYIGAQTNNLKWKFKTGNLVGSCPSIARDGTIYFGSWDKHLYALSKEGNLKWKFDTGAQVFSSPCIAKDGTIYIGSGLHLYALSKHGNLKWKFKILEAGITPSPSTGEDGTIYFGSNDFHLYALSKEGNLKWKFKTGGDIYRSSPSIAKDGTIYFGSYDKHLYALSPDGKLKWKFKTGKGVSSSPSIAKDGTIYIGSRDSHLYALTKDGNLKWKFKSEGSSVYGGAVDSSPSFAMDGEELTPFPVLNFHFKLPSLLKA